MNTDKTFECYKNRLIYEGGESQDIRYNVIEYLCSFPNIDPDEMAVALLQDGRNILFDDSSISAAQNAANRRRVYKLLSESTMEKNLVEKCETFYDKEEALACQAQHPGAEITAQKGYPIMLYGELMYPFPEARPAWTVWWTEEM